MPDNKGKKLADLMYGQPDDADKPAFGVFPQMKPRRSKQDPEAAKDIPRQLLRGWAAGTLGLPGDIEGLVRMLPGLDETPRLPTSEFYLDYLPGKAQSPVGEAAAGMGTLFGGVGSTKAARGALEAGKAAGKAGRAALEAMGTGPSPGSLAAQRGAMRIPGGQVEGMAKAISNAAEAAGQKAPVVAEKDLTTLQDVHTTLGDKVNARVAEAQKMMEGFDYQYDTGQRVFTKDSAQKNKPPYVILNRTRVGNQVMREDHPELGPGMGKVIIDPDTGKAMRTPYEPGYRVRMEGPDGWTEFQIPQSAIVGDVEMAKGGPVRFTSNPDTMRLELAGGGKVSTQDMLYLTSQPDIAKMNPQEQREAITNMGDKELAQRMVGKLAAGGEVTADDLIIEERPL